MVHWLFASAIINDTSCSDIAVINDILCSDSAVIAEKRQPARAFINDRQGNSQGQELTINSATRQHKH